MKYELIIDSYMDSDKQRWAWEARVEKESGLGGTAVFTHTCSRSFDTHQDALADFADYVAINKL